MTWSSKWKNIPINSMIDILFHTEPLFKTGGWRGIGLLVRTDSVSYAYQFISPSPKFDLSEQNDRSSPIFGYNDDEYIKNMCVHEFAHAFVNPTFYQQEVKGFINEYDSLFTDEIKETLEGSGIGSFYVYVLEHVVILLQIRLAEHYLEGEEAQRLRDMNRRFIYLPAMEKKITEDFESNRTLYPMFADFIPILFKVIAPIERQ